MLNFEKKEIIGMIHLAGPDTVAKAMKEIKIYEEEGLSGIIVENYHGGMFDVVETLKALEKNPTTMSVGLNILPNEYEKALNLAHSFELEFIQLDVVAGKYKNGKPMDMDDYRAHFLHSTVKVFGGVWPKYYTPVEGSVLVDDIYEALDLCDGIVVTGAGTGKETPLEKIQSFRDIIFNGPYPNTKPLIIGAGLTVENVKEQLAFAEGAIVGSAFKPNSETHKMVDRALVRAFMDEVNKI